PAFCPPVPPPLPPAPLSALPLPPPPASPPFPSTTLFRSPHPVRVERLGVDDLERHRVGGGHVAVHQEGEDHVLGVQRLAVGEHGDRKSTRLNSSHVSISYAVFCLKKKTRQNIFIAYTCIY